MPTEIHVTKDEFDDMGRLIRSCSGEVSVNKCEGMCSSQVQPSVSTATGFLKECFCCRENFLRERLVTLTHCYDPDGLRLEDEDRAIMEAFTGCDTASSVFRKSKVAFAKLYLKSPEIQKAAAVFSQPFSTTAQVQKAGETCILRWYGAPAKRFPSMPTGIEEQEDPLTVSLQGYDGEDDTEKCKRRRGSRSFPPHKSKKLTE
ncbi:hypothetical protein evm_001441 [Chilo suppressalis]|nr:hypothetical protein evm_001441 [Chilo suppressalis]